MKWVLAPLPTAMSRLLKAREKAMALARQVLAEGRDPLTIYSQRQRRSPSARQQTKYIEAKRGEWRNAKHAAQWEMTLREYAAPIRLKSPLMQSAQKTFCAA